METSFFRVFLQSDQAGWDNSAQKLKNTNNLAVFDHFGIVKYKIFGASGGFSSWTLTRDLPCTHWGANSAPRPQLD